MSDNPRQPNPSSIAAHPLFNQASADITLRTSDRVDFHIHSPILSQASPVFSDMLSLPQPQGGEQSLSPSRPIIEVSEDSRTLEIILVLCYPVMKHDLNELDEIVPILVAAMKYEMEWPKSMLSKDLLSIVPRSPLKVWAAASRHGLEDVARKAADEIRQRTEGLHSLTTLQNMLVQDGLSTLQGLTAGDYFRLREYLRTPDALDGSFKLLSPAYPIPPPISTSPAAFVPTIPSPDILLHCRDSGDELHSAHQAILCLHSPVLHSLLTLAGTTDQADPSPNESPERMHSPSPSVLDLDVNSRTMVRLLQICYCDFPSGLPSDLSILAEVLVASEKLEMTHVRELAQKRWEETMVTTPLQAYFVALEHQLDACARAAGRQVVDGPIFGLYAPSMERSSAMAYHRLLVYHAACARAVCANLNTVAGDFYADMRTLSSGSWSYYSHHSHYRAQPGDPEHISQYLRRIAESQRVERDGPGKVLGMVTLSELLQNSSAFGGPSLWPSCATSLCHQLVTTLLKFGSTLPSEIAVAIFQVELEIV